jgi:hypothetical protein
LSENNHRLLQNNEEFNLKCKILSENFSATHFKNPHLNKRWG